MGSCKNGLILSRDSGNSFPALMSSLIGNRPHGSLNFEELETPEQSFWKKLQPEAIFGIGNRLFGF
jgi:hypothetical protein